MAYGYRYSEVPLPDLPEIKSSAKVKHVRYNDYMKRQPVKVSLGCHLMGATMPHPDTADTATMLAGVSKRFAVKPPDADPVKLLELEEFVRKWVIDNLTPLAPDSDTSKIVWLDKTSYPEWRKKELRECNPNNVPVSKIWKWLQCSSFGKDESYPLYKHARGINSRSDEFKCAVGPIFKLIEKELFAKDYFIKKIPVSERPKYIMDRLFAPGGKYIGTDYTAFESLFTAELMRSCEFILYDYMTQYLPEHKDFMHLMNSVLAGTNICKFKNFVVELEATRMSGEMCTSLGNGFSNLMFLLFICHKLGSKALAVIEGDDCLARIEGVLPTSDDFKQLGLNIKLEQFDQLSHASFCGLIFDDEELINVTDPREVLAEFGWGAAKYSGSRRHKLNVLLRCKALSVAYQYPGCPIMTALSRYGLRVTASVDVRHHVANIQNAWEREKLLLALSCPPALEEPGIRTRILVEQLYGITVQKQIDIEKYLDSLTQIQEIVLDLDVPVEWRHYFDTYVASLQKAPPIYPRVEKFCIPIPILTKV